MIKVNNTEYYNGIVQDKRIIDFTVNELDKKQELTITLINKSPNQDTIVKDGKIVMDKLVKIEKIDEACSILRQFVLKYPNNKLIAKIESKLAMANGHAWSCQWPRPWPRLAPNPSAQP